MTTPAAPAHRRFQLALDLVMAATFVLLLDTHVLGGLLFHEIAGTLIGLVFGLHVFLNWRWVVTTTERLLRARLPRAIRLGYLLDWLLLVAMGFIIVSGVLISRVLFPGLRLTQGRWVAGAHVTVAFLVLGLVGLHVGLHWDWILSVVRRLPGFAAVSRRRASLAALVVSFGLFAGGGWLAAHGSQASPGLVEPAGERGGGPAVPGSGSGGRGPAGQRPPGGRFRRRNPWAVLAAYLGILGGFVLATAQVVARLSRRDVRVVPGPAPAGRTTGR